MKFLRLSVCGGMEFGVGHGDGAESRESGDQGTFFAGEDAVGSRIDEDGALGPRRSKRSGHEHACRHHAAEGVDVVADGDRQRLSGGHGALCEIGCETESLPIMAGAGRSGQLRRLR